METRECARFCDLRVGDKLSFKLKDQAPFLQKMDEGRCVLVSDNGTIIGNPIEVPLMAEIYRVY